MTKIAAAGMFALGAAAAAQAQDVPDLGGRTIVAVTENAYTPLNFADPDTGAGTWILPRIVGMQQALKLLYTGEMIDADLPPADILGQILHSAHTRLPVFRDDPDNIIGVVHAKDMLRAMHSLMFGDGATPNGLRDFRTRDVAMEPYFVPETTTLDDQMREFLRRHTHFALVVDEYGSLQGLITLEDILEEIVGEITDEFDIEATQQIAKSEDNNFLIDGSMTIRDLNRATDWSLPDEEANTIAGLVIHEAQIIPEIGQVFSFHGFRFEIIEREANRLTLLKIRPL